MSISCIDLPLFPFMQNIKCVLIIYLQCTLADNRWIPTSNSYHPCGTGLDDSRRFGHYVLLLSNGNLCHHCRLECKTAADTLVFSTQTRNTSCSTVKSPLIIHLHVLFISEVSLYHTTTHNGVVNYT